MASCTAHPQYMTVKKMLFEGYSYSLISTLAGLNKKTVSEIAQQEGKKVKCRKKSKPRNLSANIMTYSKYRDLPKRKNPDFSVLVRENGTVHLPHPDQCKHILSLKGQGEAQDHYCQNSRIENKSYCRACCQKLFTKTYKDYV